jgi:DNA-binding GntR family transcriptional regulator
MSHFKSTSLADQVFEKLESDIIHGIYERGEILTELKLVEILGVSRTPIREALRRLEQERLIEESGKGSVVLGITEDDLLDIMNIRESVESLAAYYAAINMTDEGRQELTHIVELQDYYFNKGDLERMRRMDDEFHDVICRLSRRNVIADTLQPLHRKTRRYRRIAIEDRMRAVVTKQEHYDICQAVVNGDADRAAVLAAQHIRNAREHMFGGAK